MQLGVLSSLVVILLWKRAGCVALIVLCLLVFRVSSSRRHGLASVVCA